MTHLKILLCIDGYFWFLNDNSVDLSVGKKNFFLDKNKVFFDHVLKPSELNSLLAGQERFPWATGSELTPYKLGNASIPSPRIWIKKGGGSFGGFISLYL